MLASAWFAGTFLAKTPFYAKLLQSQATGRFGPLDGIRGFLALSVMVHHWIIHHGYLESSGWIPPRAEILKMAGPIPVQIFFMITGFLFWDRAAHLGAKVNWRQLAISRFCRIAPLYSVAMALTLVLALISTRFVVEIDAQEAVRLGIQFLTFGAIRIWMLGDIDLMPVNAGVTWTLVYEWGFYLALPLLAWFAHARRVTWLLVGFLLLLGLRPSFEVQQCLFFGLGIAVCHARRWLGERPWFLSRQASLLALLLLAGAYLQDGLNPLFVGAVYLFPTFLILAMGNDLFGLLSTPGSRVLGNASYSIYLLHGPILFALLGLGLPKAMVLGWSMPAYWAVGCLAAIGVSAISALTFWLIENPAIEAGRRAISASSGNKTPSARTHSAS